MVVGPEFRGFTVYHLAESCCRDARRHAPRRHLGGCCRATQGIARSGVRRSGRHLPCAGRGAASSAMPAQRLRAWPRPSGFWPRYLSWLICAIATACSRPRGPGQRRRSGRIRTTRIASAAATAATARTATRSAHHHLRNWSANSPSSASLPSAAPMPLKSRRPSTHDCATPSPSCTWGVAGTRPGVRQPCHVRCEPVSEKSS
jgi:hypothetical protein